MRSWRWISDGLDMTETSESILCHLEPESKVFLCTFDRIPFDHSFDPNFFLPVDLPPYLDPTDVISVLFLHPYIPFCHQFEAICVGDVDGE